MTEGKRWIVESSQKVQLAMRAGRSGRPVACATDIVQTFAGKQLEGADMIAAAADFLSNACLDLLAIALWNIIDDTVHGEAIPSWVFARDDRVFRCFLDNIQRAEQSSAWKKVPRSLKLTASVFISTCVAPTNSFLELA